MHDLSYLRENPEAFQRGLRWRGGDSVVSQVREVDRRHRALLTQTQALRHQRKEISRQIRDDPSSETLKKQGTDVRERLADLEAQERASAAELERLTATIPNLPSQGVPEGPDETANQVIREVGVRRLEEGWNHFDLGEKLGLMEFNTAALMSGSRFVILYDALARLERALGNFMMDIHTREHGYREVSPPLLVREKALFGTGQLPKFSADQFQTTNDYWLIPTAEVPLTNLAAESVLNESDLPQRWTALTPCFRSEAGASGKDTKGMLRQHQFSKVELVSATVPEHSDAEHERMTDAAETILKRLDLPFRTVLLSSGDMGFAAQKTYDIEVWLPGQKTYREISSCSNCGAFQARRMKARYRSSGKISYVHTLNGSGVAVGRCLIALIENYQNPDQSLSIPSALRSYMDGLERIAAL